MGYNTKTGVWVLQTSEGDGYHLTAEPILGVFSSHNLAEEYAEKFGLGEHQYSLEFLELNHRYSLEFLELNPTFEE